MRACTNAQTCSHLRSEAFVAPTASRRLGDVDRPLARSRASGESSRSFAARRRDSASPPPRARGDCAHSAESKCGARTPRYLQQARSLGGGGSILDYSPLGRDWRGGGRRGGIYIYSSQAPGRSCRANASKHPAIPALLPPPRLSSTFSLARATLPPPCLSPPPPTRPPPAAHPRTTHE